MERFLAVCVTENKELETPKETREEAEAIANRHRHDSSGKHETKVFRVISSDVALLIENHMNLSKGAEGRILSGPYGENEIYHIWFKEDKNVNFRKVPSAKFEHKGSM